MPALARTNPTVILQAVEQQLLTWPLPAGVTPPPGTTATIVGDLTNIYWVSPGQEPEPGRTGQRDILLEQHASVPQNVEGDGRFCREASALSVYLRLTLAVDHAGTIRDWAIQEALIMDAIKNALFGFFPEDDQHNALTIFGLVSDVTAAPVKRPKQTWGEHVGTYKFEYVPNITPTAPIG